MVASFFSRLFGRVFLSASTSVTPNESTYESTNVRPTRRFFGRGQIVVDNVQAKLRNGETTDIEIFHTLQDSAFSVVSGSLNFGSDVEGYLSACVYCLEEDLWFTKFRVDVLLPDGVQLGSQFDTFRRATPLWGWGSQVDFRRLLKLEDLKGVDKLTVLFQFEYELPVPAATAATSATSAATSAAVVESPTPSSPPTVLQDYSNLFESGVHADITFLVGGQKIAGHKCVFVARSSVFARMFDSNMSEAISDEVEIKDIRPEVFREMAKFIYSGEKPTFLATKKEESEDNDDRQEDDDGNDDRQADDDGNNDRHADDDGNDDRQEDDDNDNDNNNNDRLELEQTATDLLLAADKYGIEELKSMCEAFLCDNLHPDNVIQLLIVAHLNNCAELMRQAGHVYRMFSRDSKLREGKKQLEKYPGLLMKLLDLCCDG